MTQDEIIEITRQAGGFDATPKFLEAFAKLVAEHEREACAKLEIELILSPTFFATMGEYDAHKDAVLAYRNLIRARGQA
jgi:RecA-family ATPase